jgi:phosphatidylserine/phosphatidylglycerophosphate/cardiolipin synthase-like enzyme
VLPDVRSRPRDACERRTAVPFEAVESPGRLDATGPLDPRLQARLTQVSGRPLTRPNRVRLLRDGADTFTAMLELIENAETEILLENYIIRADAVGRAYGEALTTRAQAGVNVRILHDPFGDPLSLLPLHMQFWGSRARLSIHNRPRSTVEYLRAGAIIANSSSRIGRAWLRVACVSPTCGWATVSGSARGATRRYSSRAAALHTRRRSSISSGKMPSP